MHMNGISHNDVKSSNIMLDIAFSPRIIDLGMAKISNSSNMSSLNKNNTIGTDNWRAPEYWQMNPIHMKLRQQYPFAGDVYSFAILLGEIATKIIPWNQFSHNDIKEAVINGMRPYSIDQMDPEIYKLIEKGWKQNANERIKMKEMADLLNKMNKVSLEIKSQSPHPNSQSAENIKSEPSNNLTSKLRKMASSLSAFNKSKSDPNLTSPKSTSNSEIDLQSHLIPQFQKFIETPKLSLIESTLLNALEIISVHEIESIIKHLSSSNSKLSKIKIKTQDPFMNAICQYFKIGPESPSSKMFDAFQQCQNTPLSNVFLGICYIDGNGTNQDYKMAFHHFQKASNLNLPAGHYYLAKFYECGCQFLTDNPNNIPINIHSRPHKSFQLAEPLAKYTASSNDLKLAYDLYKLAIKLQFASAFTQVADFYCQGICVSHDYKKSLQHHLLAREQGSILNYHNIAIFYEVGYGCKMDINKAIQHYKMAIKLDKYTDYCHLGDLYLSISQYGLAIECYENETLDLSNQYYKMGLVYLHGYGVPISIDKAREMIRKSAQMNHSDAILKLSEFYNNKTNQKIEDSTLHYYAIKYMKTTKTKRLEWNSNYKSFQVKLPLDTKFKLLKESIISLNMDQFDHNIMELLHTVSINDIQKYLNTFQITKNIAKYTNHPFSIAVAKYYQMGHYYDYDDILNAFKQSKHELSNLFIGKLHFQNHDVSSAFSYFIAASDQNISSGHYYTAKCYENGHGCKKDQETAIKYYKLAAYGCFSKAFYKLAQYSEYESDLLFHYLQGAQFGCVKSIYNLGVIYRNGFGPFHVDRNYELSIHYYQIAVHLGCHSAILQLGFIYNHLFFKTHKKAFTLFQDAANQDIAEGYCGLGYMYLNGYGIERNEQKGQYYMRLAKNKGITEMTYSLTLK
eukprot:NODE_310_length_10051_cov_0.839228.p1 type:complete len:907 gc:universal NODE_310_length_10051_cov_0.839228:8598-5878(-)